MRKGMRGRRGGSSIGTCAMRRSGRLARVGQRVRIVARGSSVLSPGDLGLGPGNHMRATDPLALAITGNAAPLGSGDLHVGGCLGRQ